MRITLNDLDVIPDSAGRGEDSEQAFTVYIRETGEGLGRIVISPEGMHVRDMAGMNKKHGFRSPSEAALYLAALRDDTVV